MKSLAIYLLLADLFLYSLPEQPITIYQPPCAMVTGPVESCSAKCSCRVGL